jgi:hypothetical protein
LTALLLALATPGCFLAFEAVDRVDDEVEGSDAGAPAPGCLYDPQYAVCGSGEATWGCPFADGGGLAPTPPGCALASGQPDFFRELYCCAE